MIALRATARLQLHPGFTLRDAAARVPYYARLGISHLYLSPITRAVAGSTHGYDVVDPATVSPELGGEPALRALARAAHAHDMGLVLDIVPNHMAAHLDNAWWRDVVVRGRRSPWARWFDIEWDAPGREGRLWLPVLDRSLAQALADGVLTLASQRDGSWALDHHGTRWPLGVPPRRVPRDPAARRRWVASINAGARKGDDTLARLVAAQPYRLAWWRGGNALLNYRRFFDITSLVALRMEVPAAFNAVHALPLRLVSEGLVDGLRVDHVDGLADPGGYVRRLRRALDRAGRARGVAPGSLALWVEKILAPGESLPADWPCDGTTGYDFMDQVGGLLHDPGGEAALVQLWRARSGRTGDFATEELQARGEMLAGPLQAEFDRTLRVLLRCARHDAVARELPPAAWAQALRGILEVFPVYRTYAGADGLEGGDAGLVERACAQAADAGGELQRTAVGRLRDWLLQASGTPAQQRAQRELRQRVEQLSAPLNAKSVEDTAFYRHGVLLSRNEVGSHPLPGQLGVAADAFHAAVVSRGARALLATATHDHKRGEDVRARLAVLAARAPWWARTVEALEREATGLLPGDAPDGADRAMLWQTLVGAWPLALAADDRAGLRDWHARVAGWQTKAMREAKRRTSWVDPQPDYEAAAGSFLEAVLTAPRGLALRRRLQDAAERIAPAGAVLGLAQATLRLTLPGIPDLYQGTEGWDLSLVDPDNRRPVDDPLRDAWLDDARDWPALLRDWRDGAVKARLLQRLLDLRRGRPELFADGDYQPLVAADGWLGFMRTHEATRLCVLVPVRPPTGTPGALQARWPDAVFDVPPGRWKHLLTGARLEVGDAGLQPSRLRRHGPIAVLVDPPHS